MNGLKIGIVTQSYYPHFGGVTEHVHHVALELERLGHSVTVITGGPEGRASPSSTALSSSHPTLSSFSRSASPRVVRGGRTLLVPSNGARATVTVGLGLSRWIKEMLRSERFDIIQCHCPLTPTLPLLALRHASCPVVGTFHACAERHLGYDIFRRYLRPYHAKLAGRIAVSEPARDFVGKYFGGEYTIIPNGVDGARFSPDVPSLSKFSDDRFNVLYVGRLEPRKGLPLLMDSFHRLWLNEKGRARLIVVGDGPLRRRLQRSLAPELTGAVHFEGQVPPGLLPHYYASSDVLCSPATGSESFGIVLLEAMASAVPVVASDIAGYRTVVTNGVQGLLVEPRSAHSLATSLGLLARDESLRLRMGDAGVERAKQFAWSKVAGSLESFFLEVLNGNSPRIAVEQEKGPAALRSHS